ncbi:hypothetical protein B0J18DRAFT_14013 [Chaetomium sp. MPI-SDFR-AT-0129]|nr:hypothetical protein B0J18DRAFT_14013 [Chaetomium sp. MPI-SDFR-AT-0129]
MMLWDGGMVARTNSPGPLFQAVLFFFSFGWTACLAPCFIYPASGPFIFLIQFFPLCWCGYSFRPVFTKPLLPHSSFDISLPLRTFSRVSGPRCPFFPIFGGKGDRGGRCSFCITNIIVNVFQMEGCYVVRGGERRLGKMRERKPRSEGKVDVFS